MIFEDASKCMVNQSRVILIVNKLKDSLVFVNNFHEAPDSYEEAFGLSRKDLKKDFLGYEAILINSYLDFTIYNKNFDIFYIQIKFYEDGKIDLCLLYPHTKPGCSTVKIGGIDISGSYEDYHEIEQFLQHFADCKKPEDVADLCLKDCIERNDVIKWLNVTNNGYII